MQKDGSQVGVNKMEGIQVTPYKLVHCSILMTKWSRRDGGLEYTQDEIDVSIEIQKRSGAYSAAMDTINKCLSEALCALSRGRLDGESRITGLIHSGNEILETFKYYPEISPQERANVIEQQNVLRQLEAILAIHKLASSGNQIDALREIARLPFLPLDPRSADFTSDVFNNISPHVEACVPGLLKDALNCLDDVTNTDGSLRAMRTKIANFLANNLNRNWPRDLYEKVARSL
ncbi:Nuclear pore complex protein nup93a [Orobanche hederae]